MSYYFKIYNMYIISLLRITKSTTHNSWKKS
ncbi:CRPV-135 [Crowpox virus]|nr:CRPV-135 [Crowpox virus]